MILSSGSGGIVINGGGPTTFSSSNPRGILFGNNATVNNGTTLTLGRLLQMGSGGDQILTVDVTGGLSGSATGYVIGKVRRNFTTGSGQSFTFHIGDFAGYTPAALANFNVTGGGNVTANTTAGTHANLATSGINTSKYVNRYWTLAPGGGLATTTYDATLTFSNPADLVGSPNTSALVVRKYNGAWTAPASSSSTSTTVTGTGFTAFSDFAAGEAATTSTAVTSSLNPSTYGDSVTFTGTVTSGGNPVTQGNIEFRDGGSDCSTGIIVQAAAAVDGSGQKTYTTSSLSAASHTIRACYSGTSFAASNGTVTQTVNQKNLTINGAVAQNKVYDGTTTATVDFSSATLSGIVGSDVVTINSSSYSANFNTKHVGTSKAVTLTGVTLSGADAGSYTVSQASGLTANITARPITVTAQTNSKVYDGSTTAAASASITTGTLASGDVSVFTESYDTKHVGTSKTLTPAGTVHDAGSADVTSDYDITFAPASSGTITTKAIDVTAVSDTKTYDGTTSSSGVPTIAPGLAVGDTSGFIQAFDTKNVGINKTLTPSGAVNDGNSGANYAVTFHNVATGVINSASLTITAVTNTKVYDGNTSAAATPSVSGLQGSDTATGVTETYDNKNAGTGKTLSVASYTVNDGNSGNNYTVTTTPDMTGVINEANATCTVTGYSVTYNGAGHTATGSCTGVGGPSDVLSGLDLSSTTHTNAGTYNNDPWTFTDGTGNYNNSSGTSTMRSARPTRRSM